jgi:transposase
VAKPQHKGKVESGVHYVQRNFMAGRELSDLPQANRDVRHWCLTTAGQRIHGTTANNRLCLDG